MAAETRQAVADGLPGFASAIPGRRYRACLPLPGCWRGSPGSGSVMSGLPSFLSPSISDADVAWITSLLGLPEQAFCGASNDDPRLEALRSSRTMDVEACPGSGKTTLLVAKLGALSKQWHHVTQGICVLSHTNVARHEIESGLGMTSEGQRLMAYPHFVGKIHSFVNEFLALPA